MIRAKADYRIITETKFGLPTIILQVLFNSTVVFEKEVESEDHGNELGSKYVSKLTLRGSSKL